MTTTHQKYLKALSQLLSKYEADCFEEWRAGSDIGSREHTHTKMKAASEFSDFLADNLETELHEHD